jgi:hypothetical protein
VLGCSLGAAAVETGVELGRNQNDGGGGMTGLPLSGGRSARPRGAVGSARDGDTWRPWALLPVGSGGFGSGGPTRGGLTPS